MTLFDVDKNNDDRSTPKPNKHDQLSADSVKAHGTTSENHVSGLPSASGVQTLGSGFGRLIKTGELEPSLGIGSTIATAWQAHELTFVPMALFALNNANIGTAAGSPTVTDGSLFLPTFLGASVNSPTSGVINFINFVYGFVDATNVYVNIINADGLAKTPVITYYLFQQIAQTG